MGSAELDDMTDWENTKNWDNTTEWNNTHGGYLNHHYGDGPADAPACYMDFSFKCLWPIYLPFIFIYVIFGFSLLLLVQEAICRSLVCLGACFRDMYRIQRHRFSRIVDSPTLPVATLTSVDTQPQLVMPISENTCLVPVKIPSYSNNDSCR